MIKFLEQKGFFRIIISLQIFIFTLTVPEVVKARTTSSFLFLGRNTWKEEIQSGFILN